MQNPRRRSFLPPLVVATACLAAAYAERVPPCTVAPLRLRGPPALSAPLPGVGARGRAAAAEAAMRLRGGGTLPFRYQDSWSDTTVVMKIDDGIKSRDINYGLTPSKLTLGIKNQCFLDIEVEGEPAGRVVVGLYGNTTPRTAENFRALCTGEVSVDPAKHKRATEAGKPLHYKGTSFHRIIPNFMVQGGDFTMGDGTGGESVYGDRFEDESFAVKHTREGLLSMANAGADCNGAQFFVTTSAANHLNGKHVVFGEVLEGYDVVKKVEDCGTTSGKPSKEAKIADCGELPLD